MTESLKQWVVEQERKVPGDYDNGQVHFLSVKSAEFWIRAFCDEVEKRAKGKSPIEWFHNLGWEMRELKRELLGD